MKKMKTEETTLNAYISKEKISQIITLSFTFRSQKKKRKMNSKQAETKIIQTKVGMNKNFKNKKSSNREN